ncbi:patatin-like phospholipase family protein [Flavobacterium sp. ZS1P70]|uniref:Patatin-like phospholipase family protein n=1 Tax=Flavobacterium zhoui TaxID=3230414 RepID=A0ABW6I795_9FLAO
MSYPIEVLVSNPKLIESVKAACKSLNKVQTEFRFEIPKEEFQSTLYKTRTAFTAEEVFEWVDEYKILAKGNRPFLIIVLDKALSSVRVKNLFGTINKERSIAMFTVDSSEQFVNDTVRFCRYYLTRYALNFLAPKIHSHENETSKDCIFHFKRDKKEIRLSLDSGKICDSCRKIIEPSLTIAYKNAMDNLLLVVSNQYPYSIVLKGGGVKGLAFAGALLELEKYYSFNAFAGTSAGAIAAVLLGAGYKPQELLDELNKKDFNDFRDTGILQGLVNLITRGGFYPGNEIENWIKRCLNKKIIKQNEIKLQDFVNHTTVYASRIKDGTIKFDSKGDRKTAYAAYAARCSMSIPYYFTAKKEDGVKVYDGGLRNNFPLQIFMEDNKKNPVIGIYLKSDTKKNWLVINEILNLTVDGEEMDIVDKNPDKIVVIDTTPIKTTDFNLNNKKKEYLILKGRIGALHFIEKNLKDIQIERELIPGLEKQALDLRYKL